MLKISGSGWAEISIENKVVFEGSYLTDIPLDFIKALFDYFSPDFATDLEMRPSSCVRVDCEGGEANFIFSNSEYSNIKVFMLCGGKEKFTVKAFDVDPYYLAVELVADIENDFENWVKWYLASDENAVRKNLTYWLKKLKDVVEKEKPYVEKLKAWNTQGTPENDQAERVRKQAIELLEKNINTLPLEHIAKHLPNDKK